MKGLYCLLAAGRWEIFEKDIQVLPIRQVIEQIPQQQPGILKNGRATHDLRVAVNDAARFPMRVFFLGVEGLLAAHGWKVV